MLLREPQHFIRFRKHDATTIASPQKHSQTILCRSIHLTISSKVSFVCSATPFYCGVYAAVRRSTIPLPSKSNQNSLLTYSPPSSVCKAFSFLPGLRFARSSENKQKLQTSFALGIQSSIAMLRQWMSQKIVHHLSIFLPVVHIHRSEPRLVYLLCSALLCARYFRFGMFSQRKSLTHQNITVFA